MSGLSLPRGRFEPVSGPVVVVVMDGVGLGPDDEGNAVTQAHTPTLDALYARYGCLPLCAHGTAVGLPSDEDMGNSEVGHNALGAGRVFSQGASLVNVALEDGSLFRSEAWCALVEGVRESGEPLHLLGLLSDGNVHSHERHLHALLDGAASAGVRRVRLHLLTDGRDVGSVTAQVYIERLEAHLKGLNTSPERDYRIASGGGRMHLTMDRYNADWDMVQRGWDTHVHGQARRFRSALEALHTLRADQPGLSDQFVPAFVVTGDDGEPLGVIRDGASVCLFNFRGDRAVEISRAFEDDTLPESLLRRGRRPKVRFAGMMQYDGDLLLPKSFLVAPPRIDRTLSEHLAENGVTQFACSETQKFGHVTYFWNGNRSGYVDAATEQYVEVQSDRGAFEERPWMKATEITDATLKALSTGRFRHARLNYANGDMVGHTGDLHAAITGISAMDLCLGRLLRGIASLGGVALVTADHGNADEMFERDKGGAFALYADGRRKPKTSHTLNPVPCVLFDPKGQVAARLVNKLDHSRPTPGLANVAATVLELLGFSPPEDYAASLLSKRDR